MSYVFAAPELVESAAQDLAGIGSALGQATAAAAGPTSSVLAAGADEVSAAISQLFGTHGQEFQAVSAQATAFHDEFVGLLRAGAGAYASAEATGAQTLLGQVAAPYQALFANTQSNLQTLGGALAANPVPLLNQIVSNQAGNGPAIARGLASLPAGIGTGLNALSTANPVAALQGIIDQQVGFSQVVASSLQHAGNDFVAGFNALPTSFQAASQAFAAGDVNGGLMQIGGGFLSPFLSGFDVATAADGSTLTITPLGAVGDLLPIFGIPGQTLQHLTNLIPAGSIPGQMAQNFTNLVDTLTDTGVTSSLTLIGDPGPVPSGVGFGIDLDTHMGLPLALAIDAVGGPANALNALGASATTFVHAAQTGDVLGAAAAVFQAPAVVADGFLNGQMTVPLNVNALGFATTLNIPLSGILVNPSAYAATADAGFGVPINGVVTGTPLGGIVPGLLSFLPRELASALGGPAPVIPAFPGL